MFSFKKSKTNNNPPSFLNEKTPKLIHWTFEMPGTEKIESDLDVSDDESFYPDNRLLNENNEITPKKSGVLAPIKSLLRLFDSETREDNKPQLVILQNTGKEDILKEENVNSVIPPKAVI